MPNLDVKALRYMSSDEFRVLTAVEMGMKNHELVPTSLIESISGLKRGGAFKYVKLLCRNKLVAHQSKPYDGYRLTFKGYDYLGLKTLSKRGTLGAVGIQIGVGKESDVFTVSTVEGEEVCLKLHRLGRACFRTVKNNRDYIRQDQHASWLYLSRLSALKEYAFMSALYSKGFPVPKPIDVNRHCVVMSLSMGYQLNSIQELRHPGKVFDTLMQLICRLASYGLIHCDFNEFNLMVNDEEKVTLIDFPQMVSTSHPNAEDYFDRDVECIRTFFRRRFGFVAAEVPRFTQDVSRKHTLDVDLAASGWTSAASADFEQLHSLARSEEAGNHEEEEQDGGWDGVAGGRLELVDEEWGDDAFGEGDDEQGGAGAVDDDKAEVATGEKAEGVPLDELEAKAAQLWLGRNASETEGGAGREGDATRTVDDIGDVECAAEDSHDVLAASTASASGRGPAVDETNSPGAGGAGPGPAAGGGPAAGDGADAGGDADADECDNVSMAASEQPSVAPSRASMRSARGGASDPLVAERVKRELRRNRSARPGKGSRNEQKDREKRKLAASTKHEASGFSGWS